MGLVAIKHISTGRKPEVNSAVLKRLHRLYPEVKTTVDGKGGTWGDVARLLTERSGVTLDMDHVLWLYYNRKPRT